MDLFRCGNLKTRGWARSFGVASHQGTLIYFTKSEATSQSSSFALNVEHICDKDQFSLLPCIKLYSDYMAQEWKVKSKL